MIFPVLMAALVLLPSAPVQSTPPAAEPPAAVAGAKLPLLAPGVYSRNLARDDGPSVHYSISIPRNYVPTTRVPLILALHFGGDPVGAGFSLLELLVRPALGELGAIIIAPDSPGGQWTQPQNEKAAMALLDAAMNSYRIDPNKVVVTGFSMGGVGTWHLANTYPERFSAAIPMASRPQGTAESWRVPVFAVHSRADEVMAIAPVEKRIEELKKLGKNAEILVVEGLAHHETGRYVSALRQVVPWLKQVWKSE